MRQSFASLLLLLLRTSSPPLVAGGPSGFGPVLNSTFTIFSAAEDLATEHRYLLSAVEADGKFSQESFAPRGGDQLMIIGKALYTTFSNAGVKSCVYSDSGGSVPASLFPLSPFYSAGASSVLGRATENWRFLFDDSSYFVGAQVDVESGLVASLSNPALYSELWVFSHFDNATALTDDAFAIPEECSSSGTAAVPNPLHQGPEALGQFAPSATAATPWGNLGLLRPFAAAAAAAGRPAWAIATTDATTTTTTIDSRGPIYRPTAEVLRTLPDSVDNTRFATPVRDQTSTCGGCWAFSSAAATEVVANVKLQKLSGGSASEHLSPQQLIDCVAMAESGAGALIDCKGCNGGWPFTGLRHIVDHGIASESSYAFAGVTGFDCLAPSELALTSPLRDVQYVPAKNATAMAAAVAEHGAVVAIINVLDGLDQYKSGVFQSEKCCSGAAKALGYCLQHAVTVVGYGTSDDGVAFWKVKNSFGAAWGEGGYFKIARGSDTCGIEDNVVVPIAA